MANVVVPVSQLLEWSIAANQDALGATEMFASTIRIYVWVGMTRRLAWALLFTSALCLAAQSNATNASPPTAPRLSLDDKTAKAVTSIEVQMKRYSIPGIALSVVYKNETILAHGFGTKAHGHADIPVTADTMFQIGSFTKTFITLAIAKFVDDGKMQWSDPVKQNLAWFSLQDKYAGQYTTLGDLLAMNSVFGACEGDVEHGRVYFRV
ncbi:hypothetical protein AC1031_009684 [Aphanomyces cochlioides]|nr:hypothetical protein AC1031_009684 [Aphanomyces cochlioides]